MKITQRQKLRKRVYEKFGGKCAYSGFDLGDDWEIDHVNPRSKVRGVKVIEANNINNLVPTFKFINMFKKRRNLNEWRNYLLSYHLKLNNTPNKRGQGTRIRNRAKHLFKLAEYFNITFDKPFNGVFYFETICNNQQDVPNIVDFDGEVWKPIGKYKNYYECSNFGRIKCVLRVDSKGQTRPSRIKKLQISREGHLITLLSFDKVRRTERVAFIVAELFIPNPNNYKFVYYKDNNKMNCRADNLFWSKRLK